MCGVLVTAPLFVCIGEAWPVELRGRRCGGKKGGGGLFCLLAAAAAAEGGTEASRQVGVEVAAAASARPASGGAITGVTPNGDKNLTAFRPYKSSINLFRN